LRLRSGIPWHDWFPLAGGRGVFGSLEADNWAAEALEGEGTARDTFHSTPWDVWEEFPGLGRTASTSLPEGFYFSS